MLVTQGRPRAAHLVSFGLLRRPLVWLTMLGLAVSAVISVSMTITAQIPLRTSALGQPVTVGFQPLSRNWCGSGQMTVVGAAIPIKPTFACSPIRPQINILGPIDITTATQAAPPLARPVAPAASRAAKATKSHAVAASPAQSATVTSALRTAENNVRQGVNKVSAGLLDWFRLWVYGPGLVECGLWAALCVLFLNLARYAFRRHHYRFRSNIAMVLTVMSTWLVLGTISVNASAGLAGDQTVNQVFGTTVTNLDPHAAGPINTSSVGASIGNSVASYFGGPGSSGYCFQAPMAVAGILTSSLGVPVKQLACSGATIANGLLGPQWHKVNGKEQPITPQFNSLLAMKSLRFVVVFIGQDEMGWARLVASCFVDHSCQSNLAAALYEQRLQQFAIQYNELLSALASLPTHPKVLINLSYNPFSAAAIANGSQCWQTGLLTSGDIQVLVKWDNELNQVLSAGAQDYGFTTANPVVSPLCGTGPAAIQPIFLQDGSYNQYALHPLQPGEYAIAFADYQVVSKWVGPSQSKGK